MTDFINGGKKKENPSPFIQINMYLKKNMINS